MEGRREGEQWRGGEDGGEREWCEVRSEKEQELTHWGSSSLASAHGCWPSLSKRSSSFACGRLVGGRLCSWVFVSVRPRSFPFTGVHFRWWACTFIVGRSSSSVRGWLRWWAFVFSVVVWLDPRGGS